ncbi:MAG: ATP-binding protein [Bacteroidales bacterium]
MLSFINAPLEAQQMLNFNAKSLLVLFILFTVSYLLFYLLYCIFKPKRFLLYSFIFVFIFSFLSAILIYFNEIQREHFQRLEWAQKTTQKQDIETELLFSNLEALIQQDSNLIQNIKQLSTSKNKALLEDSINSYLAKKYLHPSFSAYRLFFTYCSPNQDLLIEQSQIADCRDFFKQKIQERGSNTNIPHLYVLDYGIEYYAYLYELCFCIGEHHQTHLYIEMGRGKIGESPNSKFQLPLNYSYAYYTGSNMWSHSGNFLYNFKLSINPTDSICFKTWENYSHLIYPLGNTQYLIISTPLPKPYQIFYNFSFLLLFYCIVGFCCECCIHPQRLKPQSYAQRMQYTIFGLVLSAFILFGLVSFLFIKELNYREETQKLRGKALSILTEMETKYMNLSLSSLKQTTLRDSIQTQWNNELNQLSTLFFTDIYLFNLEGKLIASSNFSDLSNLNELPVKSGQKYQALFGNQTHLLIQTNKGNSMSAYAPFRNADNEILGYFILPSFDHQASEWKSEMNLYLSAYLNIFVLFSILTFIVTYILSNYVTRPLSLISQHVAEIKLTKKNRHLNWKRKDEIGILVSQYNHLVDELEDSAKRLAESERQNAWSEMAKQIAHEIKNPLTPLKLQIQLLERAYQDKKPDFDQKLHKFSFLLLEQIDLLSEIATSFAHFAQWQEPKMQYISILPSIHNSCELFSGNTTTSIEFISKNKAEEDFAYTDPKLLEQVLINLLRNALQALEENQCNDKQEKTHILLSTQTKRFSKEENYLCIKVCDNGPGIDPEKLESIFEPHFTTRSTGSGLGLAISRKIIESMNGSLSVESIKGKGSCFSIYLKTNP